MAKISKPTAWADLHMYDVTHADVYLIVFVSVGTVETGVGLHYAI